MVVNLQKSFGRMGHWEAIHPDKQWRAMNNQISIISKILNEFQVDGQIGSWMTFKIYFSPSSHCFKYLDSRASADLSLYTLQQRSPQKTLNKSILIQ